jgi:hypothetical protein
MAEIGVPDMRPSRRQAAGLPADLHSCLCRGPQRRGRGGQDRKTIKSLPLLQNCLQTLKIDKYYRNNLLLK